MNVVLLTGRRGSESIPGKNVVPVLGRPLVYYPIYAAGQARLVGATYVSTDCPKIKEVARAMDVQVIDRPTDRTISSRFGARRRFAPCPGRNRRRDRHPGEHALQLRSSSTRHCG